MSAAVLLPAAAQDASWVGGTGNFNDAANWNPAFVPAGDAFILIGNGGTAQVNTNFEISEMSIADSSTVEVFPGLLSELLGSGNFKIGSSGLGTLTAGAESLVASGDFYAAFAPGSTGLVQLNGAMLSPFTFYGGYAGNATISLQSGATLQSTTGYVGFLSGSIGLVQMANSTWTASDGGLPVDITVGAQGVGQVHGTNSNYSARNIVIGSALGSTGNFSASGGGLNIQNDLTIGDGSSGRLALSNSANATAYRVTVGRQSGSTGVLSVASSARFKSDEPLMVGLDGAGTLLSNGGIIEAPELFVGRNAGSTGNVSLTGGSLTVAGELHVAAKSTGTLTLLGGGTIHSNRGNVAFEPGVTGVLTVEDGVWTNTRAIFVGVHGNGTLNVGANGTIQSESGYLAQNGGGHGHVNISGGTWSMSNTLAVSVNGTADLSVTNGGSISSAWAQVGLNPGSQGSVVVDNGSWTTDETLTIGFGGCGTFTATNGSNITARSIELAGSSGISGSLAVANSTVSAVNILAATGTATAEFSNVNLKLRGGSSVLDTLLIDGFAPGAFVVGNGGLTVDTQGGNAEITSSLSGNGSLTKTGAGRLRLTAANTYGGGTTVSGGVLELTGNDNLAEGNVALGTAELRAHTNSTLSGNLGGGIQLVSVAGGQIGTFSAATGQTLTLAPLDFLLTAGSTLQVGSTGNNGTVVLAPTGAVALTGDTAIQVAAGTLTAGNDALGFMTSIASSTTVSSGASLLFQDNLSTGAIRALFGGGTVNIGSNSTTELFVNSGNFSGSIAGSGKLVKETSGTLVLSGQNAYIGGTTLNAGTLVVDGDLAFGFGQVTVNPGATLGGSGIVGTIFLDGGSVSPGSSPGSLTAQNLYWTTGTLVFELGPSSDLLNITGALQGFGSSYNFTFADAGWAVGSTYTLIDFFTENIAIESFGFTNGGGFDGEFSYNGSQLEFTLTAIPEPSTAILLAATAAGAFLLRLRRRPARGKTPPAP